MSAARIVAVISLVLDGAYSIPGFRQSQSSRSFSGMAAKIKGFLYFCLFILFTLIAVSTKISGTKRGGIYSSSFIVLS
jgi:hypothetical protein